MADRQTYKPEIKYRKTYKCNAQAINDKFPTDDTQQDTTPHTERAFHSSILSFTKLLIYSMQANKIFLKDQYGMF